MLYCILLFLKIFFTLPHSNVGGAVDSKLLFWL